MTTARRGIAIVLFVVLLWLGFRFVSGNGATVDVDVVFVRIPAVPLWQVLVASGALGAGLASLWLGFALLRTRFETRRFRKEVGRLEAEVRELRADTLAGTAAGLVAPVAAVEGGSVRQG